MAETSCALGGAISVRGELSLVSRECPLPAMEYPGPATAQSEQAPTASEDSEAGSWAMARFLIESGWAHSMAMDLVRSIERNPQD